MPTLVVSTYSFGPQAQALEGLEFAIEHEFQGLEGQQIPDLPDEFIESVTDRYIELYEHITGGKFERAEISDVPGRIEANVNSFLSELSTA